MTRFQRCPPIVQGFVGMLLAGALLAGGYWGYQRYREFVVMRAVISDVLKAQAQRAQAQAPKAQPAPTPEGPKK